MANIQSAEKRNRQAAKRRERNRAERSKLRGQVKKTREAIATGDPESAREQVREAHSIIDRAAKKNLIKKNAASRSKSRLARQARKAATGEV